jgi:simple sugar transport system permease protein
VIIEDLVAYILQIMIPYILASTGIIVAGRAGVFDVTVEGLMLLSASVTFTTSYLLGGNTWLGVIAGSSIGLATGSLLWYLTSVRRINQFIAGLTLLVVYIGIAGLIYKLVIGITLTPPRIPVLTGLDWLSINVPFLGSVLLKQNPLFYIAIALIITLHMLIFSSGWGISYRAVGENPRAADTSGVDVMRVRLLALIMGNLLIALSGAYLVSTFTGTYTDTIVSGRGWISIGIAIFGGWRILESLLGAVIISSIETSIFILQASGTWIPYQILQMIPFISMISILVWISKKAILPRSLGRNYDRESYEEF